MDKHLFFIAIFDAIYKAEGGWQNPNDRTTKAQHTTELVMKKLQECGLVVFIEDSNAG